MIDRGAVEEVRALLALGLDPRLPAMKAIGVRELGYYLAGASTLEEAVAAAQGATRRYAKRQTTWFRHQMPAARGDGGPAVKAINAQYSESLRDEIFSFIRHFD